MRDPATDEALEILVEEFEQAAETERKCWFPEYRGRELEFIREVLGVRTRTGEVGLWAAQRAIVEALFEHKFVCVVSCRGPGKSFAAAVALLAFFYVEPSRVLLTAPGLRLTREVLFGTLATLHRQSSMPLPGELSTLALRLTEEHSVIGIPCRDPGAVRGFHAKPRIPSDPDADELTPEDLEAAVDAVEEGTRLLVVVDEAASVDPATLLVLRGMFNKPNVYCLMISNPTLGLDDPHPYVKALDDDSGWHRVKIAAFSEIEFPDDLSNSYDQTFDHVPEYLISRAALERARRQHEADDPIFMSDWLGQFRKGSSSMQAIPRSALEAALACLRTKARPQLGPRIGVDIGAGRPDPCVASLFHNGIKRAVHEWRPESDDSAAQVSTATVIAALMCKWGREIGESNPDDWDGRPIDGARVSVDDSGMSGVADILGSRGIHVDRVVFSAAPQGHHRELTGVTRFLNLRAEMYWTLRRGLQEGVFVIPPEFGKSWQQLQWTRFERRFDSFGPVLKMEAKELVVRRHGHSPDHADADALACRETSPGIGAATFGDPPGHTLRQIPPPGAARRRLLNAKGFRRLASSSVSVTRDPREFR